MCVKNRIHLACAGVREQMCVKNRIHSAGEEVWRTGGEGWRFGRKGVEGNSCLLYTYW